MNRAHLFLRYNFLILSLLIMLTSCSVGPQRATTLDRPVKPSGLPSTSDLVGRYSLFEGSEVSFDASEQNGNLLVSMFGVKSELQKISPIRYRFKDGNEVKFDYSREGIYDRFATINEGRPQWFIREDSLQRSRTSVTNQAVYTQRLRNNLKPGGYAYSRFISPSRGLVDYSVYLPQEWKRNSNKTYPLVTADMRRL